MRFFECPPALQTWAHANTPTPPTLFPTTSHFTNMDYLFWRKNDIEDPELDMDPYPWILWFIWKARNDKLFKGINREPLETVRHAEAECKAWHQANKKPERMVIIQNEHDNNSERCLIDGSWTHDTLFSGCGWTWIKSNGETHLMGAKNQHRRISSLHSELEALTWAMECMLQLSNCQAFETNCKELITMLQELDAWPNLSTELKELEKLREKFTSFSISFVPGKKCII